MAGRLISGPGGSNLVGVLKRGLESIELCRFSSIEHEDFIFGTGEQLVGDWDSGDLSNDRDFEGRFILGLGLGGTFFTESADMGGVRGGVSDTTVVPLYGGGLGGALRGLGEGTGLLPSINILLMLLLVLLEVMITD